MTYQCVCVCVVRIANDLPMCVCVCVVRRANDLPMCVCVRVARRANDLPRQSSRLFTFCVISNRIWATGLRKTHSLALYTSTTNLHPTHGVELLSLHIIIEIKI